MSFYESVGKSQSKTNAFDSLSITKSIYQRLADFFESKDGFPLSENEVAVCLEWLRQITVFESDEMMITDEIYDNSIVLNRKPIPSTPLSTVIPMKYNSTMTNSIYKHSIPFTMKTKKVSSLLPVKQQIQAILEERQQESLAKSVDFHNHPDIDSAMENSCPVIPPMEEICSLAEAEQSNDPLVSKSEIIMTRTAKTILECLNNNWAPSQEEQSFPTPIIEHSKVQKSKLPKYDFDIVMSEDDQSDQNEQYKNIMIIEKLPRYAFA